MQELDNLFYVWAQKHISEGHSRFIRDGIVDEEWWTKDQVLPKICYFLKEGRTEEASYNLACDLKERCPWKLWKKVAIWTQAIHNAFTSEQAYNEESIRENEHALVKQIAVVNTKKSDGLRNSDDNDLMKYAKEDKKELKQELEIINPDIIVCGHTFDMLKQVLGDELDVENTCETLYGFWKDKLIINYYHPACRYPSRLNYYALMSICKVAEKDWKDRKERYWENK